MVAKQKEERDSRWVWWREAGSTIRVNGSSVTKDRDAPDFGVALGEKEYTTGKHDVDFLINRSTDNYVYVGFASPDISLEETFCRQSATDHVWYYFGCGYTCALRNGWDDVVSKEVGGVKVPKLNQGSDRVRATLDMDAGEVRFSLFRMDEGRPGWKAMPGKITGVTGPVVAAACLQERCCVAWSPLSFVGFTETDGML